MLGERERERGGRRGREKTSRQMQASEIRGDSEEIKERQASQSETRRREERQKRSIQTRCRRSKRRRRKKRASDPVRFDYIIAGASARQTDRQDRKTLSSCKTGDDWALVESVWIFILIRPAVRRSHPVLGIHPPSARCFCRASAAFWKAASVSSCGRGRCLHFALLDGLYRLSTGSSPVYPRPAATIIHLLSFFLPRCPRENSLLHTLRSTPEWTPF